jgi:hypothetical protein
MTEEDRRELDRTETEMLDTISTEEDGLILDELPDGMEDPSWPDVEAEAEPQDKIDRMTTLREAYEAYEELVALYRRKDQVRPREIRRLAAARHSYAWQQ